MSRIDSFRLRRHHLMDSQPAGSPRIASDVCGIQCQVMSAAEIGLWTRNHRLTLYDIRTALWEEKRLVKTALMRGTLHLIADRDFRTYIDALRETQLRQFNKVIKRYSGLDSSLMARIRDATVEALSDGPLTRPRLQKAVFEQVRVSRQAKKWLEKSWWGVARQAMFEGLVCYGPPEGATSTLVRTDQWLAGQSDKGESGAKKQLLRNFLSAYGPAAPQDFSHWSGSKMTEVEPVWTALGDELRKVPDSGAYLLEEDWPDFRDGTLATIEIRLLPYFDNFLLAHVDKSHLVSRSHYKKVYRKAGWISPVVLKNGRVMGTWSFERKSSGPDIQVELFRDASKTDRRLIDKEIDELSTFLERKP